MAGQMAWLATSDARLVLFFCLETSSYARYLRYSDPSALSWPASCGAFHVVQVRERALGEEAVLGHEKEKEVDELGAVAPLGKLVEVYLATRPDGRDADAQAWCRQCGSMDMGSAQLTQATSFSISLSILLFDLFGRIGIDALS